ncbi:unnamed protein product [Acanthoscelides obtectus]|uniref:Uncharacterized protein n=1 Tax=Acanthoscelides obtectus TaxID=200917 RepID=A0A9P0JHK9_ACAOB|nr:unnamed protein product [Acanthoscelides obtectus]CAK1661441.1 hypothetical protein AOBTE_LOCUS22624 [Acanthoscelides obtectus]
MELPDRSQQCRQLLYI